MHIYMMRMYDSLREVCWISLKCGVRYEWLTAYKYINKLLYDIIVFTCIVKVRKIELLKLRPAAPRP